MFNKTDPNHCPHCKMEVDSKASRCPHCSGKIYRWTNGKIAAAVIIGAFILVIVVNTANSSPSSSGAEQSVSTREVEATAFAEHIIEQLLKAPSTAKFSNVAAYELSSEKDVWAVNGYVDSENSFGAMLRNTWEVQLDFRDGKGGAIKSVLFDGKRVQ